MEINKKKTLNKYENLFFYLPLIRLADCMLHSLHGFTGGVGVWGIFQCEWNGDGKTMRLEIAKWLQGIIRLICLLVY